MLARKARMSRQRTDRNKGLHGVRSGERTMAMAHPSQAASAGKDISVRTITFDDLRIALRQGWDDFLAKRGDLLFIGFIYPIIVALAIMSASQMSILPLIFPLVADRKSTRLNSSH